MTITKEIEKVQESVCDWTSDKARKYRPNLRSSSSRPWLSMTVRNTD